MNENLTNEQQQIVHFANEGVIPSTETVPDIVQLSTDYLAMTAREERDHTVKDFLKRPIVIHTGLWSSSQAAETQLFTANFPEVLVNNVMYQEKLRGFVGLRATLVVKVQVNSQPFQQGRLMLQYFPYAQYMPKRVALVNATLQGRSGCPRSDLDLSVGTEIEMRIPYVSPHVYYNLITGQGSFGSIYLLVYSQLRDQVSGTGSIEYTVWAHLEDVDIQYPTGARIYTGSTPNYLQLAMDMNTGKLTTEKLQKQIQSGAHTREPDKVFAQVGVELKELEENASLSSAVGAVSEAVTSLGKIPGLGNYLSKPAWITSKLSNIIKALGFSKPTVQGLPLENKLRTQTRMANFDGADVSHKLALSSANEIETKPGLAGTSADEMEFSHLLSIPNFWDRFAWTTSHLTGNVLWDNYVTPFKVKPYSDTIKDRFRCTHMGYVANSFGLWRGSIVYTFKFVKTQYHSGRLRIGFIPFYYNTEVSQGTPDMSKVQQVIVDLRTSTEVSFTVPYVSTRPWMFCVRPESAWLGTNNTMMYNAVTGIVRVEVLNQLVAASNVHPSVDVIVEVHGGPDLTFANPNAPSYVPYSGNFQGADGKAAEGEETRVMAQVMGENEAVQRNDAQHGVHPKSIDRHPIKANWSPEAHCIGEKILSVRQLIKRFSLLNAATLWRRQDVLLLAPFSVKNPVASVKEATSDFSHMGMFEYYYFLYAFWRGSMRFKLLPTQAIKADGRTSSDLALQVTMTNSVQDTFNFLLDNMSKVDVLQISSFEDTVDRMGSSLQVVRSDLEGMIEFEVPYYNVSHISPASTFTKGEDKPVTVEGVLKGHIPPVIVHARVCNPSSVVSPGNENVRSVTMQSFYAPGDDFSLMYLVGVPPLVNINREQKT